MPHEIRIPRLGWSMEEGTFVGWLKSDGARINVGDPLYELEGDKALQQVESVEAGILRIKANYPQPGSVVAVGSLLGFLEVDEEALSEVPATGPAPQSHLGSDQGGLDVVRTYRPSSGIATKRIAGAEPAVASPRARRVARELKIDWTELKGTGRNGRVREVDVVTAAKAGAASQTIPAIRAVVSESSELQVIPLSPRRQFITNHLRVALERTLPVTLTTTVDATKVVELRERLKASGTEIVPTYTDIVAVNAVRVLKQHRRMAARWQADQAALIVPGDDGFHIGIAVDTPDGLLVPVVRNVAKFTLSELAVHSRQLIDTARSGRLAAADMDGGVFTITNLGAYGIDAFTPLIHYPQVAILGLGAIRRQPTLLPDGRILPQTLALSLTFDHAAIDGAPAAAFLRDLRLALED